ncbi:pilus assembly PilX N-terminal domain-containing protein [bacterium]|nr:pilus assembly PilX N-terminal domain-containing protein [bacterium]
MAMRLRADDRGMALIGVIVLTALLMSLAIAVALQVGSDTQVGGAFRSGVTGFYAAESGLNRGMGEYRNIFLDYNVPSGSDFSARSYALGDRQVSYKLSERPGNPQNIVIPSGEVFSGLNAIQYRYIVNSTSQNVNGDVEASVGAEFLVGYIPLFQFVAFYRNDLEILPGPNMTLNGRVHTNGRLYLNANNTLTIADNPAQQVFTVQVSAGLGVYRGRKDQNTCTGTVSVDMLEDKVAPFGDLDPKILPCNGSSTREVPVAELAAWKGSMIRDIGNIAIPEPDIVKPPSTVSPGGSGDPGVYWAKADLRIVLHRDQAGGLPGGPGGLAVVDVVNAAGVRDDARTNALWQFMSDATWNAGLVSGRGPSSYPGTMPIFYTDVPIPASGCGNNQPACNNTAAAAYSPTIPAPGSLGGPRAGAAASGVYAELMGAALGTFDRDYRRGGFYNQREKKWMLLLNLNVRDLILWNSQNGEPFFATNDTSEGGLVIFATIAGPASAGINNYGVRVFGSADIPLPGGIGVSADPTGVTVASDQAMYVLGNYNRGTAAVPAGPPRQPASLIGDSINVLSQRYWQSQAACNNTLCRDGQSTQSLGNASRNAQNTWINAAFLGGVDTTPDGYQGAGSYNGGLENYPRFHESWSGTSLTYQGSFVSLGQPEHVNGDWCGTGNGCNIYNPPDRLWNFDPAYNDAANLPPLTPRFVYVQQVLFTEDFK